MIILQRGKLQLFKIKRNSSSNWVGKHVDALARAVQKLKAKGQTDLHKIGRDDFALESISDDLVDWHREITDGKGLLILRVFLSTLFQSMKLN